MVARTSSVRGDFIEYSLWLVFDEKGGARMVRTQPALDRNERAMSLTVKVPRAIFKTPQLAATISIDDPGVAAPVIDIAAAQAALRDVVGCDVEIAIRTPD